MAYRELYSGGPDMYKLYLSDSNGNPDPSNAYVQSHIMKVMARTTL